jgi:hypothetical protein
MNRTEQLVRMAEQLHGAQNAEKIQSALLCTCPPTVEQLAMIAAQLLPRHGENYQAAIAEAARLWAACVIEHGKLGKHDWWYNPAPKIKITKPKQFPITFVETLRLLMPQAKGEAERIARFRQFLAETPVTDGREPLKDDNGKPRFTGKSWAADKIAEYRPQTFRERHYTVLAQSFLQWWNSNLSTTRQAARKKKR